MFSPPKNILPKFFIFILIIIWNFSGWPRIWHNSSFSPEIKKAYASNTAGIAWMGGTQSTNGTNFNLAASYDISWSLNDFDSSYFNWNSGSNPERLIITQAGDYLIGLTLPMERTDANAVRTRVEAAVYVNDVKREVGVARSGYIRLSSGHNESSDHINVLLKNLSANDYITIGVKAAPGNDMTGASYPTVASGQVSLYAEFIANTETVFTATSTQTTNSTNLNQVTAYKMQWMENRKDAGYAHSDIVNPENITLDTAGNYLIFVNIPWGDPTKAENERQNLIGKILIDGTQTAGGQFSQGYVRGDSNASNGLDYEGSLHFSGVVTTGAANQLLSVSVEQEAGTANMTVDGEQATIYVQKLPSKNLLYSGRATQVAVDSDDWNPSSKAAIQWSADDIIDTNTYTHSTTTSEQEITVNTAGDYLLIFNAAFTSAVVRGNPRFTVEVDGVEQSGAQTKSNYVRNSGNHNNVSSSLVYFLNGLTAGNKITVSVQAEAATGVFDDAVPAKLFLWKKKGTGPNTNQIHFRWRNDTTNLNTDGGWLATEDNNSIGNIIKNSIYRLRVESANTGVAVESAGRTYELQWGDKNGQSSCDNVPVWTGAADTADNFDMADTANISPDGESASPALLANTEGYAYTAGEGRDTADTTGSIGPMSADYYTELEYSFKAADDAVTGNTYCFRLYDAAAGSVLNNYSAYPEGTINSVSANNAIGEYGTVTLTDNATSTVALNNSYTNLVVVASARYAPTADIQRAPRITKKTANSFDIKVDNYAGGLTASTKVDWMAMEAGAYTVPNGDAGIKIIAGTQNTSIVGYNGTWPTGTLVNFSPNFDGVPGVIHTVASNNGAGWVVSMVNDGTQTGKPTASSMRILMNCSFDTACAHVAEDIDYIAFDTGHGANNNIDFDTVIGTDATACCNSGGYAISYTSAFSTAPEVTLIAQMGENGGNGGYALTHTGTAGTASVHYGSIDEDGPSADRSHANESAAIIAFDASSGIIMGNGSVFDQTTFRFYNNADSVQPGSSLSNENTAIANVATDDIIRIRAAIQVGVKDLTAASQAFKLQYGQGSVCSAISAWTDVDSAGGTGIWRGYDNTTPADGALITSSLLNSQTNILESYEEQNNSVNNPAAITNGKNGEWDWVIQNNNAAASTDYCFRAVLDDNSVIQYTNYPKLTTAAIGTLTVDIVDSGGASISSPLMAMTPLSFSFSNQTSTGIFGSTNEKIRVSNTTGNSQWTLTIAASSGSTAFWNSAGADYDFNDSTPNAGDGADTDNLGGQATIDTASGGVITPQSGCSSTGLSLGSSAAFNEGTTDAITLLTADASADTGCYWDLTNINISQTIPPEQPAASDYNINMTLTVTAI